MGRQSIFDGPFAFGHVHASYDVSPDGRQCLVLKATADAQTLVVVGWRSGFKAGLAGRLAR